jgi:hypothetical protein
MLLPSKKSSYPCKIERSEGCGGEDQGARGNSCRRQPHDTYRKRCLR